MPEDIEFFENKIPKKIYVTRPFTYTIGDQDQERRIASQVIDPDEHHEFVKVKDVLRLRITPGKRQEILAVFYKDNRQVDHCTIQRFERRTGTPHKHTSFTLTISHLQQIYDLLQAIPYMKLPSGEKATFPEGALDIVLQDSNKRIHLLRETLELLSDEEQMQLVQEKPEVLRAIVENSITEFDVVALSYRKKELNKFERLLNDASFFQNVRSEGSFRGDEAVWQDFFERNPWIFGYGLNFIFTSNLDALKLEQITSGASFIQGGKRVDALMKTVGFISSLCFLEIKTHKTELLSSRSSYRRDSWAISPDLSGSISQVQKTVQKAIMHIRERRELHDAVGDPTGEIIFAYQPKSYVVIGSLHEFSAEHGINQEKYSSFELFRRQLVNPEIITFDELYERARHIVEHSSGIGQVPIDGQSEDISYGRVQSEDDIPF